MDVISTAMMWGGIIGFFGGFSLGYIIRDAIEKVRQKK